MPTIEEHWEHLAAMPQFEPRGAIGLVFKGQICPVSICREEFVGLYNFVLDHELKNGYEIATGLGISAVAFGLALKEAKGHLTTIDSFIEEASQNGHRYKDHDIHREMRGYENIYELILEFDLGGTVTSVVGWSPENVKPIGKLDFAFIDGKHDAQVIADIQVLKPHMTEKHAWLFHDHHVMAQMIEREMAPTRPQRLIPKGGSELFYYSRLE